GVWRNIGRPGELFRVDRNSGRDEPLFHRGDGSVVRGGLTRLVDEGAEEGGQLFTAAGAGGHGIGDGARMVDRSRIVSISGLDEIELGRRVGWIEFERFPFRER